MSKLILGTAKWFHTIEPSNLFDYWLDSGNFDIDSATNYPIDGIPSATINFLAKQKKKFNLCLKIGSISNNRSPECDLTPERLMIQHDKYIDMFGDRLHCLMIHWDNRTDETEISETISCLTEFKTPTIGISGVENANFYHSALKNSSVPVRVQYNYSSLSRYKLFDPTIFQHEIYGIGKLDGNYMDNFKRIRDDCDFADLLIGPKHDEQLKNILMIC